MSCRIAALTWVLRVQNLPGPRAVALTSRVASRVGQSVRSVQHSGGVQTDRGENVRRSTTGFPADPTDRAHANHVQAAWLIKAERQIAV